MYLHVNGHDQSDKLHFQLWLKKPKLNCLSLPRSGSNVPSRIEVGIKQPMPKLSEEQSSQLQSMTNLTCRFDFDPSFPSISNGVSDKLMNGWTISLSSEGEATYVET